MERPGRLRLFDMLNAIQACEKIIGGRDYEAFAADDIGRLAVERALEIISEASRHLSVNDTAASPEIPWQAMADLGNILRHAYDRVEAHRIHATATEAVAVLKPVVETLYARHKRPSDPWPGSSKVEKDYNG